MVTCETVYMQSTDDKQQGTWYISRKTFSKTIKNTHGSAIITVTSCMNVCKNPQDMQKLPHHDTHTQSETITTSIRTKVAETEHISLAV